jgi:hypothetical protein
MLDEGWETSGLKCHEDSAPFYAGNFWWAKASYINTLDDPIPQPNRLLAESWIGRGYSWPNNWLDTNNPHKCGYLNEPTRFQCYYNEIYHRSEYTDAPYPI